MNIFLSFLFIFSLGFFLGYFFNNLFQKFRKVSLCTSCHNFYKTSLESDIEGEGGQ